MFRDCIYRIVSLYKSIACVKNQWKVNSTKEYVRNFKQIMQNKANFKTEDRKPKAEDRSKKCKTKPISKKSKQLKCINNKEISQI